VPVIEELSGGIKVKVGSVPHPMEEKHLIKFIEIMTPDAVYRAELKAGMAPEAVFPVKKSQLSGVREFCNVHGLWKGM
jgi:superoxide reductase